MKAQLTYSSTLQSGAALSAGKRAIAAALLKVGMALLLAYAVGVVVSHIEITPQAWSPVSAPQALSVFTA